MAITLKKANYAKSTLASGITDTATSLTVVSGTGSKFPSTGVFRAVLWGSSYVSPENDSTREIVEAQLSSGDTFTITRAKEGTTAKAWSAGDNFALVFTKETIEEIETEVNAKVTGPASATNNAVVLFDGTTGKLVKNSAKTLPTGTIVGTTDTQTLSNKTLDNTTALTIKDANLTIQDDADTTKQAKFQASSITTGTTQVFTLPDATTTLVGTDTIQTLTNKRHTKRVYSTTSTSSITPDISTYDVYQITALAANLTINAPIGTPTTGDVLVILIKDNSTSRTLTFNSTFKAMGQALPTATTAGKRMEIIAEYDGTDWLTSYTNEQ